MLPADTLTAISNVVALNLEPQVTMAVLGAVLAPLLRSPGSPDPELRKQRTSRPRARRIPQPQRRQERISRSRAAAAAAAARGTSDGARQRAARALAANPGKSLTAVAEIAGVSRGTVVAARGEFAKEARKQARKEARTAKPAKPPTEPRQRARGFLLDALAHGPKQVSDVEAAAAKAHVDPHSLERARAELGVVTSRGNAGGVMAVQWSLPPPAAAVTLAAK